MSDLDPELARLFAAERARTTAPADAKARVLERVLRAAPMAPPTAPSFPYRTIAAVVAGAVGGAAVTAATLPPRIVYVDRVVAPASAPAPPASVTAHVIQRAAEVDAPAPPAPSAAPSTTPEDSLAKERQVLDIARTALGRGDGDHALEAVEHHAREFPRGQMTEEREAIAVQALAKLGRRELAAARGERFKKRYPNSVLLPVINAALAQ